VSRDFLDYLEDMVEYVGKAVHFTEGMEYDEFVRDEKTALAVVKALEIVGEAAEKIPAHVKERHPRIPWREMAGMRDRLTHGYFSVDLSIVWKVVKDRLPALKSSLEEVIRDYEDRQGQE